VLWCAAGVITRRLNAFAFGRFDELPEGEKSKYLRLGDEGYAVLKETMCRVKDPVRQESCNQIINQVFAACGLNEGSSFDDLPGCTLSAEVFEKEYNGATRKDVKNFRKVDDHQVVDLTVEVELEADKF